MPANARTGNWTRVLAEPQSQSTFFDDFHGDTFNTLGWDAVQVQATGGTAWNYVAAAGNPANSGWAAATTGTGDNDTEAIFGALDWMANRATSENLLIFEARVNLPSIAAVGMSCGFTDARTEGATLFSFVTATWTTTPTNAVAWSYDTDATTDSFRGIGVKADTDTAAVLGVVPVNDTPVVLRIEIDAAGVAYFHQDDIGKGAVAAAVTITTPLCPFIEVSCKGAGAAKVGEADYVFVTAPR